MLAAGQPEAPDLSGVVTWASCHGRRHTWRPERPAPEAKMSQSQRSSRHKAAGQSQLTASLCASAPPPPRSRTGICPSRGRIWGVPWHSIGTAGCCLACARGPSHGLAKPMQTSQHASVELEPAPSRFQLLPTSTVAAGLRCLSLASSRQQTTHLCACLPGLDRRMSELTAALHRAAVAGAGKQTRSGRQPWAGAARPEEQRTSAWVLHTDVGATTAYFTVPLPGSFASRVL